MRIPTPRQLPSGKWFVQVRIKNKSFPITRDTKEECVNEATYIKASHAIGQLPIREKEFLTIDQLVQAYILSRENKGRSPSTVRGYIVTHNSHFNSIKHQQFSRIRNWQDIINEESNQYSGQTMVHAWGLLAASFRYAGLPVPNVSIDHERNRELPFLGKAQLAVFLNAIRDTKVELAALLALHSLRCSEIYALTRDHIDTVNRTILVDKSCVLDKNNHYVIRNSNKTKLSTRTIPIFIPRLLEIIEDKTDPLIDIKQSAMRKTIRQICENSGLPNVGLHGLRRSFASLCHSKNIPERTTMLWGGWSSSVTMHKFYIKLDEEDLSRQAQTMMLETYDLLTKVNTTSKKRWKLKRFEGS